jgi:uncharacterized membrane protein
MSLFLKVSRWIGLCFLVYSCSAKVDPPVKQGPSISFTGPKSFEPDGEFKVAGQCSPNGAKILITAPDGFDKESAECECVDGSMSECPAFQEVDFDFSTKNAEFTVKITDEKGNSETFVFKIKAKETTSGDASVTYDSSNSANTDEAFVFSGECEPDGTTFNIEAPEDVSPSEGSCECESGSLTSCTEFSFADFTGSSATFIFSPEGDADNSFEVVVSVRSAGEEVANLFGAPFGPYMEDGIQSTCLKSSDTKIICKGVYFDGENDVTSASGWASGATIAGYFNLEASTYIEDSKGEVWSVSSGTSAPVGRSGDHTTLGKITFTGRNSGNELVGIHGEHSRASALFDDGQVFSWNADNSPVERLTTGVHTAPIKYIYEGYSHECFIDKKDDLYCKTSTPSSTPAYQWTPSASEKAYSDVLSIYMGWNSGTPHDTLIRKTNGRIIVTTDITPTPSSTYTDTGITSSSSAGVFGYIPGKTTGEYLIIDSNGKLRNQDGIISGYGSSNVILGLAYNTATPYCVLSGDKKIYCSADTDMSSATVLGGYTDMKLLKTFYTEICGIRESGEIRCFGTRTGGDINNPTNIGTVED